MILPGATIGMLGGGQLGRMSALAARRLGYRIVTLDPTPDSACGQISDHQIVAPYDDPAALSALAERADVVTYEFENVPVAAVERLLALGLPVHPGPGVLRVSQDRLAEKEFARDLALDTVPFAAVRSPADLARGALVAGFPARLKRLRGGYDGKGQWPVTTMTEAHSAMQEADGAPLLWEAQVEFVRELSVLCVRAADGTCAIYPPIETVHVDGILDLALVPARVRNRTATEATDLGRRVAEGLNLVGVCAVELFLMGDGRLLLNEIAPRPHNSGHLTIEAAHCSQFEQHVRAICGLPLGPVTFRSPATMANLLGSGQGEHLHGVETVLREPGLYLHLYGKQGARAGRKMGHLTVLDESGPRADERARAARRRLQWVDRP